MLTLDRLRRQHPRLYYRSFAVVNLGDRLLFRFDLEIEPRIRFRPWVEIGGLDPRWVAGLSPEVLNNLAFHLGLMEIPSYWKATCSPEIVVQAGPLDGWQLAWWKQLLLDGQGEFFFRNQIDFTAPDFVDLRVETSGAVPLARYEGNPPAGRVLVPVGGGKDSAVTLDLLARAGREVTPWVLNPTRAALDIIGASGGPDAILVRRTIDPGLLRLNEIGYLNGHTPFSAYLAFLGVALGVLSDHGTVALSNERSSNEGNAFFMGTEVNHQYSKSFDFEKKFRAYSRGYLAPGIEYFSLLRPLYELQIARLFARLPRYFALFRSCNRGQRDNSWCLSCSKCLFAYAILFPFLDEGALATIFAENLFDKPELVETAYELLGHRQVKPFECVGAREESLAAFYLSVEKVERLGRPLPPVLQAVKDSVLVRRDRLQERADAVLHAWNGENAVPPDLQALLRGEAGL